MIVYRRAFGGGGNLGLFNSDSSIFQANRLLAKTINIGYAIEFGKTTGVKDSLFKQIGKLKEEGFTAVRVPVT